MDQFIEFALHNGHWVAALLVALMLGTQIERLARRRPGFHRRRWTGNRLNRYQLEFQKLSSKPIPATFDAAEQLRIVEQAIFTRRDLLNRSETRLFHAIEAICAEASPDFRVMAQVSLGEILASPDELAYRAINSKRVDLLIVSAAGHPLHAVEYQGSGHNLGPAATRDAIKREALRRAGISYVEVMVGDAPSEVRAKLLRLLVPSSGSRLKAPFATA